jgi:hypothetical protein
MSLVWYDVFGGEGREGCEGGHGVVWGLLSCLVERLVS